MATQRKVEIFSAGCGVCDDAVAVVRRAACPSCEVIVHDMKDIKVAERAKALGIRSVPAVLIDGEPSDCCTGRGIDEQILRAAGLGQPRVLKATSTGKSSTLILGAALATIGASICCTVPLVLALLGISDVRIANLTALDPWRHWLTLATLLCLALA